LLDFEFLAYLAKDAGKVYAYRIRRKPGDEDGRFLPSDPSIGYRLAWLGQ